MHIAVPLVLLTSAAATGLWLAGRTPSLWVAPDGSVRARGSRLREGSSGDGARLATWLKEWRPGLLARKEPLTVRAEPGTDFAHLR